MREILQELFEHKTLSQQQAKNILVDIASAKYNSHQVAAFMSVYLMRPITIEEFSGFREAMLDLCLQIKFSDDETMDIVGTGGDGKNTFNISTLACFIAAGAGIKVTKHGNYGVSSVSGSSNVLEAIGYKFTKEKSVLQRQLNKAGLCFLHAPLFHPAMKNVAPIRKELRVKTFFNLLGPLVNPCFPKYQLLGVYNLEIARLYNYLLQNTTNHYVIVHSLDGYDEISLTGDFKMILKNKEQIVEPEKLGFQKIKHKDLSAGKTIDEAAKIFLKILKGEGTQVQNHVVIANAAMAIFCVKEKISLTDAMEIAKESLHSGKALKALNQLLNLN